MKPRSELTVSSSGGAASAIASSTESPDERPWWQVMQRASAPSPSTTAPEGKVTVSRVRATSLWQASHSTVVPIGTSASTTPGSLPSAPR